MQHAMRDSIVLYVNGRRHEAAGAGAFDTLSRWLRDELRQTGTKIVCEEGDCGACTVLIGRAENDRMVYRPVNSCIQFLFQLDCSHVITVEGLRIGDELNPVQQSMVQCHGAQCGYCTPGFVVAMTALFDSAEQVTERSLRDALTGNLCRCTGYEPILKAGLEADRSRWRKLDQLYPPRQMLDEFRRLAAVPVTIEHLDRIFFAPTEFRAAVEFKSSHPKVAIVQGATDVGVTCNKRGYLPAAMMSLGAVPGLDELQLDNGDLMVGGRVSLTAFENYIRDLLPELYGIMELFGSPQIKNVGTLAGNIANASPIADTLPFLYVMEASLELTGTAGRRTVPISSFYKGYKTLDLGPDELITRIRIPLRRDGETLRLYKVSKRRHLDISSFTAAIRMRLGERIESARIAYGGVGPVVLRLPRTEQFLTGKRPTLESFEAAGEIARNEIAPISDVRGSADFRRQLASNILKKFYYEVTQ